MKADNNPIIKWNKEKDGVEVIADGYHFIVGNIPDVCTNWYKAYILCVKLGGYLPSVDELNVMVKYIKEINQCFKNNNSSICLLYKNSCYLSSSEYSSFSVRNVDTGNGVVYYGNKTNNNYVRTFLRP